MVFTNFPEPQLLSKRHRRSIIGANTDAEIFYTMLSARSACQCSDGF